MPGQFDRLQILESLLNAPCAVAGQFVNSSNYTFFLNIQSPSGDIKAVYKPVRGETPLWDFPRGSLAKREVAAFLISEALDWHIVPPTVFRRKMLPFGRGSVQYFIDHDPNRHYFNLTPEEKERLKTIALFDCLINNADRKGSHILQGTDGDVYCIDHGVCFHVEEKLRTVIWDFAGLPIPPDLLQDLRDLLPSIGTRDGTLFIALKEYLKISEIKALAARARRLIEIGTFPIPTKDRRQFPWPPV